MDLRQDYTLSPLRANMLLQKHAQYYRSQKVYDDMPEGVL